MFEVTGYGNIFLVKAENEREAEAKVHEWANNEDLLPTRISVTEVMVGNLDGN